MIYLIIIFILLLTCSIINLIILKTYSKVKSLIRTQLIQKYEQEIVQEAQDKSKKDLEILRLQQKAEENKLKNAFKAQEMTLEHDYSFKAQELENIFSSRKKELIHKEEEDLTIYRQQCKLQKENLSQQLNEEIENLKSSIEDYKAKQDVITSEILRKKKLTEEEDFYRINLSEEDKEDLKKLKELERNFNNKTILNKVGYDTYIRKPLLEMIKRVLAGKTVSGIYKITYIPTKEAYIGKSTDVGKRWTEHAKSVFGIGTIASALVHKRMARDGIWNFTWELLEEVPKNKLNEREKYWINFYNTKEAGMNEKAGG